MVPAPPAVPTSRAVGLRGGGARQGQDVPRRAAVVKAATGEIASDEELGGAELHAQVAGTAEYLAENDADGVRLARDRRHVAVERTTAGAPGAFLA